MMNPTHSDLTSIYIYDSSSRKVGAWAKDQGSKEQADLTPEDFFRKYVSLFAGERRKEVQQALRDFTGHHPYLTEGTPWKAILNVDPSSCEALTGAILTLPPSPTPFSALGFLGIKEEIPPERARELLCAAEALARSAGIREIRTPIDFNFFYGYRFIDLPEDSNSEALHPPLLYGEPPGDTRWHRILQDSGYITQGTWQSHRLNLKTVKPMMKAISDRFLPEAMAKGFHLRPARLSPQAAWLKDLKMTYELLCKSYQGMPEFTGISWESFRYRFKSFRHLLRSPTVWFLEDTQGSCAGFLIAFFDPAPLLRRVQKFPAVLRPLTLPWLLWRLKDPKGRDLLLTYAGKSPHGPEIKGVIGILMHQMLEVLDGQIENLNSMFLASDSQSWKSMPQDYTVIRNYRLYRKTLAHSPDTKPRNP
jgi:hypothetical protein